ncbi:hypothetical protein Barb6_00265 [Bacteroidales bacterium Barb6]|nr:hypothetical protein Barb6_00265 [Bacteroidales bacterium Barb6]
MENFEKNIFIHCPFDNDYYPLLRPVLFTVLYHGHIPRIATESFDSGNLRIEKIKILINSSKYSIHDLSRIEAKKKGDIYRLNMPFELGLDFGCKCFSNPDNKQTEKRILIIEEKQYRYMRAISDINGFDIKFHENEPIKVVRAVRNWFVEAVGLIKESPTAIWDSFTELTLKLRPFPRPLSTGEGVKIKRERPRGDFTDDLVRLP